MNRPPLRIVVGFDGTESARHALDRAIGLAGVGSRVTVVHVTPVSSHTEDSRELLAEAEVRLREESVFGETLERIGNPTEELIAATEDIDADLIVVGSNKKAVHRILLGSVSTGLVRRAACDVLVAR
jgi:nucleotide-binding universal stress UspA family protein